jgi:hypothetical protein
MVLPCDFTAVCHDFSGVAYTRVILRFRGGDLMWM